MNKYLMSEGSVQLGMVFIERHGGFVTGSHNAPLIGYFCKVYDEDSDAWNAQGHGLTYDLAMVSLYLLRTKGELPKPPEYFSKTNFYLEN